MYEFVKLCLDHCAVALKSVFGVRGPIQTQVQVKPRD